LERKKGRSFMPIDERTRIIQNLKMVDGVILFNDNDGSATEAIHNVKRLFPNDHIIFANGGDRTDKNIPEMAVQDVEFIFGVGGEDKKNSSSWILEEWKAPRTERQWGYYRVLHEAPGMKVKELTVNPGKSLSMQRHFKRSEYWVVEEGACNVAGEDKILSLSTHETIDIPVNSWHQLINPFDKPCRIVEIQYGEDCQEEDIERK
jgi:mannose-6-phosphate isomerase-like protein (cupin superfamily)